ncbi:MAG: trypsin-like peptidase domain-containing protein [Lachnospiraceae bacterium]|nr:trypsin-like peptidase domain-containing protein [Lachnospiraceae bacterium]
MYENNTNNINQGSGQGTNQGSAQGAWAGMMSSPSGQTVQWQGVPQQQAAGQAYQQTQTSQQTYEQSAQHESAQSNNQTAWQASGQAYQQTQSQTTQQAAGQAYRQAQTSNYPSHEKKSGRMFGKVMTAICFGLLFGLFAGAGFVAVQKVMGGTGNGASQQTVVSSEQSTDTTIQPTISSILEDEDTYFRVLTTETTDITEVVERTMPSMVSITETYKITTNYWGQTYTQEAGASGSGIIIGETADEYIIVTNNHVIEDADEMTVTFINGEEAEAHLKGTDATVDIAVISVLKTDLTSDTLATICVAELGDSESLVLGQNVIAIGNALGYGQSVTTGIVSALNREITTQTGYTYECIQTDAAINPGNSGGALLNMAGQVIGINQSKSGGSAVEGMGYAIPISSVKDVINELMGRDTLVAVDEDDMGYIGIYMQEVTPEIAQYYNMPQGVYVSELVSGGGAENAGIRVGDIIVAIDGNKAITNDGMKRLLKYYAAGDDVEITFMRNEDGEYTEHTVTVTLGEKPSR